MAFSLSSPGKGTAKPTSGNPERDSRGRKESPLGRYYRLYVENKAKFVGLSGQASESRFNHASDCAFRTGASELRLDFNLNSQRQIGMSTAGLSTSNRGMPT